MKKPCEYCGCDLPLGVDKDTRRIRSRHFASCKARPSLEVESPAPVPTSWMEMVTVNLLREGVNKHKARELAEHFYTTLPAAPAQEGRDWSLLEATQESLAWRIEYEVLISRTNIGSSLRKFKEHWAKHSFVSEDKNAKIESEHWRNRVEKPLVPLTDERVGRTDREIVDQTEELAGLLMQAFHRREKADPLSTFRGTQDIRAQHCWQIACKIQEMLTDTDPMNAVAEVDDEAASFAVYIRDFK